MGDSYVLFPEHPDLDVELLVAVLEEETEGEPEVFWREAFPRPRVLEMLQSYWIWWVTLSSKA